MIVFQIHPKCLQVILILLALNTVITDVYTQSTTHISGIIQSEEGDVLYKALIRHQSYSAISDLSGYYQMDIPITDTIHLEVSYLGCETIDTLISASHSDSLVIHFTLNRSVLPLPEVSVRPQSENLFERSDWVILDYLFAHDLIVLLVIKRNEKWLYAYSTDGLFVDRLEVNKSYNELHSSCLSSIYVLGSRLCAKVDLDDRSLRLQPSDTRKRFDQFVAPCLFKFDNQLVFKSLQQHNQRADYFFYDQQQPQLLYSIYDKQAAQTAQSYHNTIVRLYVQTRATTDEQAIDYGFQQGNIIAEGSWDGDLTNLIISNEIHQEVGYYKAVLSRPLRATAIKWKNQFLLFDFVAKKTVAFRSLSERDFFILKTDPLVWEDRRSQLLLDDARGKVFLLDKQDNLYELIQRKKSIETRFVQKLVHTTSYAAQYEVYEDKLYFIRQLSYQSPINQLRRVQLK
ncbi:MAG: hypothetical protein AAF849_17715 [Bacteroidota bacterium]